MENNYVPEIYVGDNGNWFVNGYDTGTKAQGEPGKDGVTPHIGCNGNWFIGETDTGVEVTGPKGDKGNMGYQGLTGLQGLTGPQGPTGETGPQGITGLTGPEGDIGPKGEKGDPGTSNIKNNFTTTEEGYALDARQGQILNSNFSTWIKNGYVTSPIKEIPANGFAGIDIEYTPPEGYELALFNAVVTTYKGHANIYYSTETKSFSGAIWNDTNTPFNSRCTVYVLVKKKVV